MFAGRDIPYLLGQGADLFAVDPQLESRTSRQNLQAGAAGGRCEIDVDDHIFPSLDVDRLIRGIRVSWGLDFDNMRIRGRKVANDARRSVALLVPVNEHLNRIDLFLSRTSNRDY